MANRPAPGLVINDGDRAELVRLTRSSTVAAGLAQRARIVLAAGSGMANTAIAVQVGVSVPTVLKWRGRFAARGLEGLGDQARSGRPRVVDHRKIVATTLKPPPKKYGVTHWSSRLLADHLGMGNATVARAWRQVGVQPWRSESFRFSTDPELVAKVTDIVGLYLAPPQDAIVLCVDEKSQIQALDRTAPVLTRATFSPVGGRRGCDLGGCGRGGLFGVTNRVVGSLARGLVHPEGAHGLGCEGGADRAQAGPAGRRDRAHRLRARRQPARGADGGRPGAAPARPGRLKKLVQTLRPPRTVTIDTDDHTITAKPQLSENAEQILAKLPPIAG